MGGGLDENAVASLGADANRDQSAGFSASLVAMGKVGSDTERGFAPLGLSPPKA
jgi:hypothetical protein